MSTSSKTARKRCCVHLRHFVPLFALIVLMAAQGWAQVTVDFESLPAPSWGSPGLVLKNQLAGDGVTFQGATVLDFSAHLPNFTHSGSKAVELCYGAEFGCKEPLSLEFTVAQKHVKLWVGSLGPVKSPIEVVLRAFDASGTPLAFVSKTIGPSAGPIPISVPLVIPPRPSSDITRVTFGSVGAEAANPVIFNGGLVVDDVEFDTKGKPPECKATQPPGLLLIAPVNGQVVLRNAVTVEADLNTPDPFATIEITASSSTPTTNTYGPVFAQSGKVTYANVGNLLFVGANALTVTAKDCGGVTSRSATVTYRNDVTQTSILVIDDNNVPVPKAEVYANGTYVNVTDSSGRLNTPSLLSDGDDLVARKFVDWKRSSRGDVAFWAHITNVAVDNSGNLIRTRVKFGPDPLSPQVIQVSKKNALIGLNLLVSMEWDASKADIDAVRTKLIDVSQYLFNATDGQILVEKAYIVDNAKYWDRADIWIMAQPAWRPLRPFVDCPLGGFFDDNMWCGRSRIHVGNPTNKETFAHEFGHYGFGAGDEYADGTSVACTASLNCGANPPPAKPYCAKAPAASCMMYHQSDATKLCSHRPENPHVAGTDQGDASCWDSVVSHYKDWNATPRWILQTPDTRGLILGTINGGSLPAEWKEPKYMFDNSAHPNLCAPLQVTLVNNSGAPVTDQEVWLHTTYGQNILLGTSDKNGKLTLYSIHIGDTVDFLGIVKSMHCAPVVAKLMPGGLQPNPPRIVTVVMGMPQPEPRTPQVEQPSVVVQPPVFRIVAALTITPTPKIKDKDSENTAVLLLRAESPQGTQVDLADPPEVKVSAPGERGERKLPVKYDGKTKGYVAKLDRVPINAELRFSVVATDTQGRRERTMMQFRISRPDPANATNIFSPDGGVQLRLPAEALPRGSLVTIGPSAVAAPALTGGEEVVIGPLLVDSFPEGKLARTAIVRFRLPHEMSRRGISGYDERSFKVLQYDSSNRKWVDQGGTVIPFVDVFSTKTRSLGTFVLVGRRD